MTRRVGFVETPMEIAKLMVELITTPSNSIVLDTGCGNGVFLEKLKERGFENCVGIDIDDDCCDLCKSKFPSFEIITGNFLKYKFQKKFDLIIGNPPYVHFNALPKEMACNVKEIIKTSEGDIYYAFIIRSINLLKENGELIYIVPYHFFYNTYAKAVREHILKHGKIEIIIDLDEVKLFEDENPETIIFKFRKGNFNLSEEKIKLLTIKTRKTAPAEIYDRAINALANRCPNDLFNYQEVNHYINSDPWSSFFIEVPDFPFVKLKDIAMVGVGLVSGFDEAFIIKEDDVLSQEEKGLVKNFVKAKNCNRFIVNGFTSYILIDDSMDDEKIFQNTYPTIYKKLLKYKEKMSHRYLPENKKWFNWMALRNYNFLISNISKPRIYVPTLDRHPYNRFSLGDKNLLPSGDVLFIQPYNDDDMLFLLGFLNSNFFRKYYLSNGGKRGGRISFTQRLLSNAKIPSFSSDVKNKIKEIVKEIIMNLEKGEDISHLEKILDDLIYDSLENRKFTEIKRKKQITLNSWL
jgi:adenine-specific DNA-methyltransferase